jgi:hypothetical protein
VFFADETGEAIIFSFSLEKSNQKETWLQL